MKGNNLLGIAVLLVIVGSVFVLYQQSLKPLGNNTNIPILQNERKIEESQKVTSPGKVLAGKQALFVEFDKGVYDKALSEGKIIFLDFYANWCPICRAEEPNFIKGFNELTNDQVIGFRVNFNDSDTDTDEKALAQKFKVPYQHTKIILKNRKEFSRSQDAWEKDTFLMKIDEAVKGR